MAASGAAGAFAPVAEAAGPGAAAVARALKYLPKGAVGIVHVEIKAQIKEVVEQSVKAGLPEDFAKLFLKMGARIDAVDVYLLPGRGSPMPLLLVHGKIGGEDLTELAGLISSAPPVKKADNGRYTIVGKGGPPIGMVVGDDANDVPAGVTVMGLAPMLTTEFLKTLGKGDKAALAAMLKGVDTTAAVWGAADTGFLADPDAPKRIVGSVRLVTKGISKVEMIFSGPDPARDFEQSIQKHQGIARPVVEHMIIKRTDAKVTLETKAPEPLLGGILAGLARARM
ncbi:MAG TPA: hypothetical protein VMZ50_00965, partial [Phycisphaerae bacterium]|nr:hypothetical protein [Phycisphaerae bacterium]